MPAWGRLVAITESIDSLFQQKPSHQFCELYERFFTTKVSMRQRIRKHKIVPYCVDGREAFFDWVWRVCAILRVGTRRHFLLGLRLQTYFSMTSECARKVHRIWAAFGRSGDEMKRMLMTTGFGVGCVF